MSQVSVKYVGPYTEVAFEVYGLDLKCAQGATISVPQAVAGKAPKGSDPGAGLLAQPSNWKPAKRAATDSGDN